MDNLFQPPQIIDVEPVVKTEQVGWEYFAPKVSTLGEMLEAIAANKRQIEQEAEEAMGFYIRRRQIGDIQSAIAQIADSEILEICPQASPDLGNYRAECEAAIHRGVKSVLEGNKEFKL